MILERKKPLHFLYMESLMRHLPKTDIEFLALNEELQRLQIGEIDEKKLD